MLAAPALFCLGAGLQAEQPWSVPCMVTQSMGNIMRMHAFSCLITFRHTCNLTITPNIGQTAAPAAAPYAFKMDTTPHHKTLSLQVRLTYLTAVAYRPDSCCGSTCMQEAHSPISCKAGFTTETDLTTVIHRRLLMLLHMYARLTEFYSQNPCLRSSH